MCRLPQAVTTIVVFCVLLAPFGVAHADPNVDASKTDVLTNDVDVDGVADPGDTITYTVIITNNGDMDATGVSFSDTIDANSTLVAGSVKTTPIALDDTHNVTGNVQISVPPPGVLANDSDPDGGSVTAIAIVGGSSTNGGGVDLAADGSFTYNPKAGFTGIDSFTYTIQDTDSNTDSATVSLSVNDVIWFVDAGATCPCDGRRTSPFDDLAVTTGSFDQNAVDGTGDIIFVAAGSYNGGLSLLDNQKLIGDGSSSDLATVAGITLAPNSVSIAPFSGTDPLLSSTGDNLTVGQDNLIRGLTIGDSTGGTGILGTNVGTLSVSEASISGTGGALNINSGILDVSLDALSASSTTDEGISLLSVTGTFSIADTSGTISISNFPGVDITGTGGGVLVTASFASVSSTDSASRGIRLENLTSGSSFDGGNATVTASTVDGLVLSNNAGSAFTFADLDINNFSTNQRGLFAGTTGTLNISDGDIDGGSGRGVDIDNTNLNVTLASVTSIGGSTAGIDLNTTTGTFEIAGDGSNNSLGGNASGGTISNKTGNDNTNDGIGVLLNSAAGVTLRRMQLNDFTNFAIRGTSVTGFALNNSTVDGANGTSAIEDEASIRFENLLGSALFADSVVSGGVECNILVNNSSGTLDRMTVIDSTIGLNDATSGNDAILVESLGSAVFNITVTGTTFLGARGDLLQTNALGTSTMDVLIQDNTFQNAHTGTIAGGGGITLGGGSGSSNINVTYEVSGTTGGAQSFMGARGSAISALYENGAGTVIGAIHNNAIGVSGSSGSASTEGSGIVIRAGGSLTHTVDVNNNDINGVNGFAGIDARANNSSTLNATITNNTADEFGGFSFAGLSMLVGGASGTDTSTLCADISNNTFDPSAVSFTSAAFFDQISASAHYNLPGYSGAAGGASASTDIATYLTGRGNTLTPGAGAPAVDASLTSGITGAGTTCPLLAVLGQGPGGPDLADLTQHELDAIVAEAIARWSATRLTSGQQRLIARVIFEIVDLPNGQLGSASFTRVSIDTYGAGYGWFSDVTYADAEQFLSLADSTQLLGVQSSDVCGKMDLLTVVTHELGHVLGRSHSEYQSVMAETLSTGVRRVPPPRKAEPKTYVDRTKRGSDKVERLDRAKDSRVLAAPSPRAVAIARSIMMAVLGSGETVGLSIGTLPPGKSITITFDVTVNSSIPSGTLELCNQGIVSGGNFADELTDDPGVGGIEDPTCTDVDVLVSDFAITKDDGQVVAVPGMTVTYTIVVTNNGPEDATGATVSDTFPAALSCSWTCTASAGSSCTAGPVAGDISDSVDLLNGGTATYTSLCDVSASATGSLFNTATVTPPGDRFDPNTSDNSATDIDTLGSEVDLSVAKTDTPDPVVAGNNLIYTITVQNAGPSDANGVFVNDTLPAGVGVSFVQTVGCLEDPNGVPTCSLGPLPIGGSSAYTIEVTTTDPASIGTIVNSATVGSATTDTNPTNDSDSESTTVIPPNLPPTADADGPYPVDEGGSVQLDGSGSSDPENGPLTFAWDFDNDGMFDDATGVSPTFSAASLDGPDSVSVGLQVTDDGGLTDTTTAEIQVANVAPSISATPQTQDVQYSDRIVDVTVDATDIAADTLSASTTFSVDGGVFVAGLPSGLSLTEDGCTVTGNTQTCTSTLSGVADVEAGVYTIRVTSQDDDGDSADADITLNVSPEDATVSFDGGNPVALQVASDGGDSGNFVLAADVMEFDDPFAVVGDSKLAGNIVLAGVSITLVPVGPGSTVPPSGACSGVISSGIPDGESANDYDILTVTCPFDEVPVNAYTVQVDIDVNGFYTGSGEDVLTIFDPSLGFTTGGGTIFWPGTNDRTNFGFTVKYGPQGGAKGNLLLIRHLQDGSIFRLKSNKMIALAIGEESGTDPFGWASFSGKANYREPGWLVPIGNHTFIAYVEDHGTPGTGADRFWIEVSDKDGLVVPDLSMDDPATTNAETIEGGNISVPQG